MKSILTTQWNLFRIIRLLLGVAVLVQGVNALEILYIIAGFMVVIMALLNVGCCGPTGCSLPQKPEQKQIKTEVIYEEVVK